MDAFTAYYIEWFVADTRVYGGIFNEPNPHAVPVPKSAVLLVIAKHSVATSQQDARTELVKKCIGLFPTYLSGQSAELFESNLLKNT